MNQNLLRYYYVFYINKFLLDERTKIMFKPFES